MEDERLKEFNEMVEQGYIAEDSTPLKCYHCGSTELEDTDEYYEEHLLVECAVKCKACGKRVGYYAYGYWEL